MTIENIYLQGNFAPVEEELTAFDLEVIGTIPAELEGRYLRNGPNPVSIERPEQHHWFAGNGMVHGVRLRGGRAEWYRNRYVRSQAVCEALGEQAGGSQPTSSPNTNVAAWAGRTLALVEGGGAPVEMGYELDTLGARPFGAVPPGGFTAHPKFDPLTGEWHAMCYAWAQWLDHIKYVVVGADGEVSKAVDIPLPGMVMLHDMALTRNYAVVFDLPVTVDMSFVAARRFPYRWNPDYTPRIGLLPRTSTDAADIIWCDIDPCYGYGAGVGEGFAPGDLYKHDMDKGTVDVHRLGAGRGSGEPDFVPRERPVSEDDGWLMSYVYDAVTDSSELLILDALDVTADPLARVILPQRVPFGFHGNWISDHAVQTTT